MGSGHASGLTFVSAMLAAGLAHAACLPDSIEVRGEGGISRFHVEVADDGAERAKGLMLRDSMASMAGMLFVYESPRQVAFWMKNTLIPLDMVFADAAGRVTRVHANAEPGNLTPVDGGDGVQFVLEINGGMADKLGIGEGAVLRHPAIDQTGAAWPCE